MFSRKISIAISATILLWHSYANAQIVPDTTLPSNSQVSSSNQNNLITGGTTVGQNLFHSFKSFSVPSNNTVDFVNGTNIANIISRVTGNSISEINGIIKSNSRANLFLLNPNGIIFGPNSQLNLGGSLTATTANSIDFLDGKTFRSNDIPTRALLSTTEPKGLNINSTSGSITILGIGQELKLLGGPADSPVVDFPLANRSLQAPNQTLAFIGRGINIDGGILSAPSGNIVLSSVDKGQVRISSTPLGFSFNHDNTSQFSDIRLDNQSLLITTGILPGNINIQGRDLELINRSIIINSNYSNVSTGRIDINLSGDLIIKGNTNPSSINPLRRSGFVSYGGIITQNFLSSKGPSIFLSANNYILSDFAAISTLNFSEGKGGDINVSAQNNLLILGKSPAPLVFSPSYITTFTSSGDAGDVKAEGKLLNITGGGLISSNATSSSPLSTGDTGNIKISFEQISISGGSPIKFAPNLPISFNPSVIGTTSASSGDAGDVALKATNLFLYDGGRINSTTNNKGDAGDIEIDVKNSLVIAGQIPGSDNFRDSSQIVSSSETPNEFFRVLFNLPELPSGKSGSININAQSLVIENGGLVNVRNDGPNDAGEININSRNVNVSNGQISATTNGGDGGNVILDVDFVLLKDALLSASALKLGKGGNISADANLFVALGESSLTAEAEKGQGGNITIAGKAVFLGPDVDVSVSSDAGLQASGTFKIVVKETDLDEATTPAPDVVTTPKVSSVCNPSGKVSEFVVLGSGGLQKDPESQSSSFLNWGVESSDFATTTSKVELLPKASFVEAKGWQRLEDGKVKLTATPQDSSSKVATHPPACPQPHKKANSEPSA